jgi:FAD:protein FMN transferase
MQSFWFDTIGTHLEILLDIPLSEDIQTVSSHIRQLLESFEQKYSRFIIGNWLDTLNISRMAHLDNDGYVMLSFALNMAEKTQGYFDPTVAGTLSSLGYGRIEHQNREVGWKHVHLDHKHRTVELWWSVILEFWGVGKWYLIDQIRSALESYYQEVYTGWKKYLINFGGDIYGYGMWKVGLENPYNTEEAIGIIDLKDGFLACSSGSKRKWGTHHHLVNPHEWVSASDVVATYIEWISWIETDSYATVLSVMPFPMACEVLESEKDIEWVLLASDGRYFQSSWSQAELFLQ